MRETSKELTFSDGSRYRVSKLSPMVASRIFNLLMTCVMKAREDNSGAASEEEAPVTDREKRAAGTVAFMWMLASTVLEENVYAKIQSQCLLACAKLEGDTIVPIRMADGRWAVKELETDAPAIERLVSEVIQYNIAPFFLAELSKAAPVAPETAR